MINDSQNTSSPPQGTDRAGICLIIFLSIRLTVCLFIYQPVYASIVMYLVIYLSIYSSHPSISPAFSSEGPLCVLRNGFARSRARSRWNVCFNFLWHQRRQVDRLDQVVDILRNQPTQLRVLASLSLHDRFTCDPAPRIWDMLGPYSP